MRSSRRGFSLIEVVIVVVTSSVLMSIAVPSVNSLRGRSAVTGARMVFSSLHARARAQAIERGGVVTLVVDAAGNSVALWAGGVVLETVRFDREMHVDIVAPADVISLCMTARGYADPDCNSFVTAPRITFRQNDDSASLTILPMGQLVF